MKIGRSIDELRIDVFEVIGIGESGYTARSISGRAPVVDNVVLNRPRGSRGISGIFSNTQPPLNINSDDRVVVDSKSVAGRKNATIVCSSSRRHQEVIIDQHALQTMGDASCFIRRDIDKGG